MGALHDASTIFARANGTSRTQAHTNGAGVPTDGILTAFATVLNASDIVTAVTYNGIAPNFTHKVGATHLNGGVCWKYLWKWNVPAAGAHDLVITVSAAADIGGIIWSMTQASQDDFHVAVAGGQSGVTDFILTVTTTINDCLAGMFAANDLGAPTGVGAGQTSRGFNQAGSAVQVDALVATPNSVFPRLVTGTATNWSGYGIAVGPFTVAGGGVELRGARSRGRYRARS